MRSRAATVILIMTLIKWVVFSRIFDREELNVTGECVEIRVKETLSNFDL